MSEKKPLPKIFKKWWFWVGLIVLFLILVCLLAENSSNNREQAEVEKQNEINKMNLPDNLKFLGAELVGKTNNNVSVFNEFHYIENEGVITIGFNANDNLSSDYIKNGIERKMTELYKAIYTKNIPEITLVNINAYFPMIDRYGNASQSIVYKTSLDKESASKINWENDIVTLYNNVLPQNWELLFVNPNL